MPSTVPLPADPRATEPPWGHSSHPRSVRLSPQFGEHFEFDCKDCVCLEGGSGIVCQPKQCSQEPPASCEEDGTYLVTEVNPADTCCNITFCSKARRGWRARAGVAGPAPVPAPGPQGSPSKAPPWARSIPPPL